MNRRKISGFIIVFVLGIILFFACKTQTNYVQKSPDNINFDSVPYPNISDYGFFVGDLANLEPNERVLLYEPSSMLFTDYTSKSRYIWMPKGKSASIIENDWHEFDFPDGTIIVKNFYYPNVNGKQKIMETRLLVKNNGKWDAFPYWWNEEQTDAKYKMTGNSMEIAFTDDHGDLQEITYLQPNKNQCKSCHNQNEEFKPIGPRARNINFDLDYGNGEVKNQLQKWQEVGYLSNFTLASNYPSIPNYEHTDIDLNLRARAYLDANCAYCHNPIGPASTSGLILTYEETDTFKLGYYKTPVAAGMGAGPHKVDILPGKADSSILVYRMNSIDPGVMMPELGRVMIHKEGVQLISDWINSMK
jgi:uncharacterized repeat protein (TIGR03806 family)